MEKWQRVSRELIAIQKVVSQADIDIDTAMQAVIDGAIAILPEVDGAAIEIVDGNERVYRMAHGMAQPLEGMRHPLDTGLTALAIGSGDVQVCDDALHDPRVNTQGCQQLGIRSLIVAPLPRELDPPGVIKLFASHPNAFEERDVAIAQLLVAPLHYALARAQASATARTLEATFEQAAVGMAHVAPEGSFLKLNRRFCEIAGYSSEELLVDGFQRITHPDDLADDLAHVADLLSGVVHAYTMEKRYIRKDGGIVWVNLSVSLVRTSDGDPDFMVAVIEDISARKLAESLASYDPLTGLANRRMIVERLDQMLDMQASSGAMVGLAFLDLDHFKAVNDRLGHLEGDRCLMMIAEELNGAIRKQDLLGRYGGDEFVLLMADVSQAEAEALLTRLGSSIRCLSNAYGWGIGASIGATIAARPGVSAEEMLRAADALMYGVKHDGCVSVSVIGERRD